MELAYYLVPTFFFAVLKGLHDQGPANCPDLSSTPRCPISHPAAFLFLSKVALLSKAVLPRQVGVEELGEILELVKNEAGGAEKYQFVDVREEEELGMAKLDGE